ncbi:MAG: peptidylprolyl isomerase [Rhizobiaceae bacterium]
MKIRPVTLALSAFVLSLSVSFAALNAHAQDSKVVATVGGEPVTEADIALAQKSMDPQIAKLPEDQRRLAALAALVDIRVVAMKARQVKFDQSEEFKQQIALMTERALHDAFFKAEVVDKVTDADVRARYDKEIAAMPPQNEVRARHILVKTEEEAKDIIKKLDGGAKFEDLAKEKSSDGSAGEGGDLGYFGAGQMVPEFEKQAFTIAVGQYTKEPVKTQFGFHVIKVEDKRAKQPPAFDQVSAQVRDVVLRERYVEAAKAYREELKVEWVDPAVKKAMEDAAAAPAAEQPKQ